MNMKKFLSGWMPVICLCLFKLLVFLIITFKFVHFTPESDVSEESESKGQVEEVKKVELVMDMTKMWEELPECECGTTKESRGQSAPERVVGGGSTFPREFPWFVLLKIFKEGRGKATCGATIINDRILMTAAHCIYIESNDKNGGPKSPNILITPDAVEAFFHIYNQIRELRPYPQRGYKTNITEVIPHPGYTLDTTGLNESDIYENDVALLVLDRPLNITDPYFNPVCLPKMGDILDLSPGKSATLIGFGKTGRENASQSMVSKKIEVPFQRNEDCLKLQPEKKTRKNIIFAPMPVTKRAQQKETPEGPLSLIIICPHTVGFRSVLFRTAKTIDITTTAARFTEFHFILSWRRFLTGLYKQVPNTT